LVLRFGNEMDVIALDAEVNDPEVLALGDCDRRLAQGLVHVAPPQRTNRPHDAHVDVQRPTRDVPRPLLVRLARVPAFRRPTGARRVIGHLVRGQDRIRFWYDTRASDALAEGFVPLPGLDGVRERCDEVRAFEARYL